MDGARRQLLTCWEDELPLVQAVLGQQAGDEVALSDVHLRRQRGARMGGKRETANKTGGQLK